MDHLSVQGHSDSDFQMAKAEIDALMAAFFRLFAVCGGGCVDLSPIFDLFIPQGMIVKNTGPEPVVYDLKGFIAPREQLLNSGELSEFWEEEVAERTHIFGNIAQRLSLYRKGGVQSGVRFEAAGMKTTQFVRTPEGWRISALAWDDCRDGVEIPERYRTGDNGYSL